MWPEHWRWLENYSRKHKEYRQINKLQSWPKCVGQVAFFGEFQQYSLPPPSPTVQCWMTVPKVFSTLQHWTGGKGEGRNCWLKHIFYTNKRKIVYAVHFSSLSHIILARIVAVLELWAWKVLLFCPVQLHSHQLKWLTFLQLCWFFFKYSSPQQFSFLSPSNTSAACTKPWPYSRHFRRKFCYPVWEEVL